MILWKGMWNTHKAGEHPVKKYVKWTNLWNTLWKYKKSVPGLQIKRDDSTHTILAAGEHYVVKYIKWTYKPRK